MKTDKQTTTTASAQPENVRQFKIGQRLEWLDISLKHFLDTMVVTKVQPLTVKFQGTGAVGEVCAHQVQAIPIWRQ